MKMHHINIKLPIFNERCHIFYPYNKTEANEWLQTHGITDWDLAENDKALGQTLYENKKGCGAIIFLKKWDNSAKDHAVLNHEVTHAAAMMMHNIGIDENREKPEVLCHFVDYMTEKFLAVVNKGSKTKKEKKNLSQKQALTISTSLELERIEENK
jgi:hypothetical protein